MWGVPSSQVAVELEWGVPASQLAEELEQGVSVLQLALQLELGVPASQLATEAELELEQGMPASQLAVGLERGLPASQLEMKEFRALWEGGMRVFLFCFFVTWSQIESLTVHCCSWWNYDLVWIFRFKHCPPPLPPPPPIPAHNHHHLTTVPPKKSGVQQGYGYIYIYMKNHTSLFMGTKTKPIITSGLTSHRFFFTWQVYIVYITQILGW